MSAFERRLRVVNILYLLRTQYAIPWRTIERETGAYPLEAWVDAIEARRVRP